MTDLNQTILIIVIKYKGSKHPNYNAEIDFYPVRIKKQNPTMLYLEGIYLKYKYTGRLK